jgi:mono/diheme cytochrome c family protein
MGSRIGVAFRPRRPTLDAVPWRAGSAFVTLATLWAVAPAAKAAEAPPREGAEVWGAACAACHGADGAGQPRAVLGFDADVNVPDLRDCAFATAEPTADWFAVVHEGGPTRGLNRMMPAYGGALRDEEIRRVVDYARGFCSRLPDWPLGDLNLPRALFTEKAFPENELVLASVIALRGPGSVLNQLIYERRLGARSMIEVAIPFGALNLAQTPSGMPGAAPIGWTAGIGDLGAAFKHAAVHSARTGTILSFGLDVSVPTGRADRGLGAGVTVVGPFVACGQLLPAGGFVQGNAGADLPVDLDTAQPEIFWRVLLGWSLVPSRFGRMYSPMLEVLGARELGPSDASVLWDLAPQMQVTVNRRKHVRLNVGAVVPVNRTEGRHVQLGAHLLWDWYEGSPLKGW